MWLMNSVKRILILILFLVPSSSMLAQEALRLEILGGASFNNLAAGVFSNWGDGWMIGAGGAYRATKSIEIVGDVIYSRYPYSGANIPVVVPDIAGLRWSVSGQPSDVIEGSIGGRLSTSSSFIDSFLSLRTGFYRINIGDVVVSEWLDSDPRNVFRSTYQGTGVSTTKGFAALGLGVSVPFDSKIKLIFEGRFAETFDAEESFLPIQVAIQIGL
jgi:hypothetical protein